MHTSNLYCQVGKNIRIFYKKLSTNDNYRNLILVHGWGQSCKMWCDLPEILAKEFYFNVYSLDLPGFGNSSVPDSAWSLEHYAQILKLFTDKLNIRDITVIGHSFGAAIAFIYSQKYETDKVILVGSNLTRTKDFSYKFFELSSKIFPKFAFWSACNLMHPKNYKNKCDLKNAKLMNEIYRKSYRTNLLKDSIRWRKEVNIIHGRKDKIIRFRKDNNSGESEKVFKYYFLDKAGHFPHIEDKKNFLAVLNKILIK